MVWIINIRYNSLSTLQFIVYQKLNQINQNVQIGKICVYNCGNDCIEYYFSSLQTIVLFAVFAYVSARPGFLGAPVAYSAPLLAAAPAPYVAAHSSQVVARNYNGIAAAPVFAHAAPVVAHASPVIAARAAPLAYSAPLHAAYAAAPLAYSAPLAYAAPGHHAAYAGPLGYSLF